MEHLVCVPKVEHLVYVPKVEHLVCVPDMECGTSGACSTPGTWNTKYIFQMWNMEHYVHVPGKVNGWCTTITDISDLKAVINNIHYHAIICGIL